MRLTRVRGVPGAGDTLSGRYTVPRRSIPRSQAELTTDVEPAESPLQI